MAEEHHKAVESGEEVEVQDRGLFDFLGKKKEEEKTEECHEEVLVSGVEKIHLEEAGKEEDKKEGLLEKLHRSHSSSSSSVSSSHRFLFYGFSAVYPIILDLFVDCYCVCTVE